MNNNNKISYWYVYVNKTVFIDLYSQLITAIDAQSNTLHVLIHYIYISSRGGRDHDVQVRIEVSEHVIDVS